MNTQHTPGPWKAINTNGKLFPSVEIASYAKVGRDAHTIIINQGPVREMLEKGEWSNRMETCQANAHLIAAAPELLKECQEQLCALTGISDLDRAIQDQLAYEECPYHTLASAIAKALGK